MKTTPASEANQSAAISEFQHFCDGVGAQADLDEATLAELLDQIFLGLDTQHFNRFTELLDAPQIPNPCLEKLMALKPVWEK